MVSEYDRLNRRMGFTRFAISLSEGQAETFVRAFLTPDPWSTVGSTEHKSEGFGSATIGGTPCSSFRFSQARPRGADGGWRVWASFHGLGDQEGHSRSATSWKNFCVTSGWRRHGLLSFVAYLVRAGLCSGEIAVETGGTVSCSVVGWSKTRRGDVQMNKTSGGTVRSAVGQGEKSWVSRRMTGRRRLGFLRRCSRQARSAFGSAKDAVSGGVDAVSALDFSVCGMPTCWPRQARSAKSVLRRRIKTLADAGGGREFVECSWQFAAIEAASSPRISKNPWAPSLLPPLLGCYLGKMS